MYLESARKKDDHLSLVFLLLFVYLEEIADWVLALWGPVPGWRIRFLWETTKSAIKEDGSLC